MVKEFPELQGRMGYYYALQNGEPEAVAMAIEEQYLPRHAGDRLAATAAGQCLALADRLDTLAGVFALGKRPSGNKDPFGLRRSALGMVRTLIEAKIDLPLPEYLGAAIAVAAGQDRRSRRPRRASSTISSWTDCAPGISTVRPRASRPATSRRRCSRRCACVRPPRRSISTSACGP